MMKLYLMLNFKLRIMTIWLSIIRIQYNTKICFYPNYISDIAQLKLS